MGKTKHYMAMPYTYKELSNLLASFIAVPSFDATGKPGSEPGPACDTGKNENTEVQEGDLLAEDHRGTGRAHRVFTPRAFLAKRPFPQACPGTNDTESRAGAEDSHGDACWPWSDRVQPGLAWPSVPRRAECGSRKPCR